MTPPFVVVMPALDDTLAASCIDSMCLALRDRLLLVDNTEGGFIATRRAPAVYQTVGMGHNAGVGAAWNMGVDVVAVSNAEYLILISQSIQFGLTGGADFLAALERDRPPVLLHANWGWKLIALHRDTLERVGQFDSVFAPAYREETDYLYRMHLAGLPSPQYNGGKINHVHDVDAISHGDALMVKQRKVTIDFGANTEAWMRKWGGEKLYEKYDHPYNRPDLDWTFVGPPPEGA